MTAIEVVHLTKRFRVHQKAPGLRGAIRGFFHREYREVQAVEDLSFTIAPGELVGFIGPNGAGKTTTLKMLSGLLYPTAGRVTVLGYTPSDRQAAFQKQFTMVMGQRSQLWWDLPAWDSFLLNKEIYEVPDEAFRRMVQELSELLELEGLLDIPVKKLSLGQRMKAELACSLLHHPQVLFLDEPTLGLDVVMQHKIRQFITAYNRTHRATILLTSHNMDDVAELCERVIIIDHGHLLYDGRLTELVSRYAPHKLISVDFHAPINTEALAALGRLVTANGLRAQLEVPRAEVSACASTLLGRFPVADLSIEEPPIERVIRSIFTHQPVPPSHAQEISSGL
ncbi:MAG: ATP-binding cassette domain-containing protein [Elusimicrobia bacterium]|nr:ATP-binding cassette domain-containing protein [Elusimicrobiota bacterium]